jgi:nitrite reductase (NO-forming)
MRPRSILSLYQLASRVWLTGAGLSLLLPASVRLDWWLPLHLALAGAISLAIDGAMQNFALTLTATPAPPVWVVASQFGLANAAVILVAVGHPADLEPLVVIGGACFVAAAASLGWIVRRSWKKALNRRHSLPIAMYGAAIVAVVVGGALGGVVGSGLVGDPQVWTGLRQAHLTLNLLGWVSLTICGTLVTLLPTVRRIRMPSWHGVSTGFLLAGGVVAIATGLALRAGPLAAIGGVAFAAGALGVAWLAGMALRTPRTWPVPVTAKHFLMALGWFVLGSLALAVALVRGLDAFAAFRTSFLALFVVGWALQTLLGAWLYLLPMARPGHPEERRRQLAATEFARTIELIALNAGVAMMALAGAGWVVDTVGTAGAWLALGGGGLALAKAWLFPLLAKVPALTRRHAGIWGA